MIRSKRFVPIQEIASNSANELSRAMADAGRRVADLERQLEQLKTYRDEYVRKPTEERGAMDAVKLQNYRSFLDHLGEHAADRREQREGEEAALRISLGRHRETGN